jgi:peroxiredoxin
MVALALAATIVFNLPDTEGARHTSARLAASHAAVFVFLSPTCPLSSRYAPDLVALHAAYTNRNVLFYGVLADPSATPEQAREYAERYRFTFPVLLDPPLSLASQLGAKTTPEAVLVAPDKRIVYRGRIDDRAAALTRLRPAPTRHDLRDALDAFLDRKAPASSGEPAIGCAIPFPPRKQNLSVTFSNQIAPILFRHCAPCHRPNQGAPFPLLSYQDAAPRAGTIAAVTASRAMPPWNAAPQRHRFQHERRLSNTEIALLARWAANGAPEGNAARTPPAPEFADEPPLGPPDFTLEMSEPFDIPASGPDIYRCFVLPTSLDRTRWVRAIDFVAGSRATLHHALVFADTSGTARKRAVADDSGPGYSCFGIPGFLPAASYGGWSPGMTAQSYPEGVAFRLPRGADVVVQIHYHPTGKLERDRSAVRFYLTDTAPTRQLMDVALGSRAIDIPAGESSYRITDAFTLPVPVTLNGVIPHAHYICRQMKGWAILPNGRRIDLITIPDWDFNWQYQYRYAEPIRLPAETRLEMEFVYDNSAGNPRNPNSPPKRVVWGPDSTDEMAGLHFQVIPDDAEDARELGQWLWGKIMRELGGGILRTPELE